MDGKATVGEGPEETPVNITFTLRGNDAAAVRAIVFAVKNQTGFDVTCTQVARIACFAGLRLLWGKDRSVKVDWRGVSQVDKPNRGNER